MTLARILALSCLAGVLAPGGAHAFPGSVRWGYANCRSCHVNLAGGGVLTPYGRQLSRELLSTWGGEKEAEFGYGRVKTPPWLSLGGDLCLQQTSSHRPGASSLSLLNADGEMAFGRGRLTAVATAGLEPEVGRFGSTGFLSRRHYLQYDLSPTLSVRAGRFLPAFGIWNGDATTATRAGLGWDEQELSYNVEAVRLGQRFSGSLTAIAGRLDRPPPERESGGSASGFVFFGGKRKAGLSVLATGGDLVERRGVGVSTVIGIGEHAYLLMETDLQRLRPKGAPAQWQTFSNWCLARETVKGLYVLLVDEWSHRDLGPTAITGHSYGASLRWFPRPHLEMQLRWRRQDEDAVSPPELDGVSTFLRFYP